MLPPACRMNDTKLEVCENEEEPELSDVEDDVFVRGRSNGFRLELYDNAKKPLMAPRKKHKDYDRLRNGNLHTEVRSAAPSLRVLCVPICYVLIATFAMLGIIALIAVLSHYISIPLSLLKFWRKSSDRTRSESGTGGLLPCDTFKVEDVWVQKFPKLLTESAFRLLDVNGDGVDDIIFGFATGADGYEVPEIVCDIYFYGQKPCFGGVLALNGRDGAELWRHWTLHEVFALNCNEDITGDGIRDCLLGGRAEVFSAVNGKNGHLLWDFGNSPAKIPLSNIYTPQFIRDVNDDQIPDILAVHGGDPLADPGSKKRVAGRILILSGKTGEILQWMETPDGAESYYSPQILTGSDGADFVLLGTGGETHAGSLYVIPLHDITNGHTKNARLIYKDSRKGIISTPVLADVNSDGVEDIVIPLFNSTVVAFDGISYKAIWNYTFPSSETYTTPTPGYFNEDNIPDFLVKYQTGPGFPIYYEAQTTVLDGRSGESFLTTPLVESIGSQASTPLIRVQGYGNDIFLFWTANCVGDGGNKSEFHFKKGTNVHEQSRANLCKLRFGTKQINQLHAFNRETGLPGALIYDSESRREAEYSGAVNTSLEGQKYLEQHPNLQWRDGEFQQFQVQGSRNGKSEQIPSEDGTYGVKGLNFGREYSEAEVPQNLPYPSGHSVRKHGGGAPYRPPPRPNQQQLPLWPAYDDPLSGGQGADDDFGRDDLMGGGWEAANQDRVRRHVGPHDGDGIQRLISTGTLAKPLWGDDGIDFIFATYWFFPAKTQLILPKTKKCIEEKMMLEGRRFEESNDFFGMDHDQYEDTVTKDCLRTEEGLNENQVFESQATYDPYNLHMGQMSVYRLHISCSCAEEGLGAEKRRCGRILPMDEQPWTGYMGSKADSHFAFKSK